MRPSRYILLMTLLVAALAAQQVVGCLHAEMRAGRLVDLQQLVVPARRFARQIERREQRPERNVLALSPRLTLRRLRLMIARLMGQDAPPVMVLPFHFRLPPPVVGLA